jgi:hypothetical protein
MVVDAMLLPVAFDDQSRFARSVGFGWWAAIQKEYASLLEHATWEKILRTDVPVGDHAIGCKWVMQRTESIRDTAANVSW